MAWTNGVRTLVAIAALTGCFQDTPTGGGEGTTGGDCPIGSRGCACTGGGGCDVGLECLAEAGICIDVGCTPGDGMCSCDAGACEDGFECVDDYCRPPGGTSTPSTDPSETFPHETMGTTDFTSGTMTDFSEVSPPETFGTMESGTFGTGTAGQTCLGCLEAAREMDCFGQYEGCGGECEDIFDCFGTQEIDCCGSFPPPPAWSDFATCAGPTCTSVCGTPTFECRSDATSSST
jgi:hypothetical protein